MILDFEMTLRHVENGQDMFLHNAPVLMLFTSTSQDVFGKDHSLHAMSYFMAQAQAMGYGTCIIGHVQSAHKLVAQHVKIKKYHRVFGAITLGRPRTVYHRTVCRKAADVSWVGEHNR
jgi:nitroreductase